MDVNNLRRRANLGNVVAQSILGLSYLDGIDVETDYSEAFRLLSAAAAAGAPRAMAGLAKMYAEGRGVAKDIGEAIRLYSGAAERGEFLAQIALGRIYSRGLGVSKDLDAAIKWYTRAANQEAKVEDCAELREAKEFLGKLGRNRTKR